MSGRQVPVEDMAGVLLVPAPIRIVNLSLGGAQIEADRRLEIEHEYALVVRDRERRLDLRGRVAWCAIKNIRASGGGETVPLYQAGLKLTNVLSSTADDLLSFIEQNRRSGDTRLLGGRVQIDPSCESTVIFPLPFTVRAVGGAGMSIEVSAPLDDGATVPLKVDFGDGTTFSCLGAVQSCISIPDAAPRAYAAGIEFLEVGEAERRSLDRFIHNHGKA